SGRAASGSVSGSRCSQRAVHTGLASADDEIKFICDTSGRRGASTHPRPFVHGRIELPKVVEGGKIALGIVATAPKEPEMAAAVGPGRSGSAASGDVSGSGRSQRAVDSGPTAISAGRRHRAAPSHPRPFVRGRIELPKVVEKALLCVDIVAIAPKEPEIASTVGPAQSVNSASGDVSGGRRSQGAVHSGPAV